MKMARNFELKEERRGETVEFGETAYITFEVLDMEPNNKEHHTQIANPQQIANPVGRDGSVNNKRFSISRRVHFGFD